MEMWREKGTITMNETKKRSEMAALFRPLARRYLRSETEVPSKGSYQE